jgi:hypothetical protein
VSEARWRIAEVLTQATLRGDIFLDIALSALSSKNLAVIGVSRERRKWNGYRGLLRLKESREANRQKVAGGSCRTVGCAEAPKR